MTPGKICLAAFPFGGTPGSKTRPVLLLTGPLGTAPELLVAYITSVFPATLLPTDMVLDPIQPEHVATNLKNISLLRLHKLATIHHSDLARYLGKLSPAAQLEVNAKLRSR